MPKHDIKVKLIGTDGNAFSLIGKVGNALKKAGVPSEEVSKFTKEAMEGDYNHLLRVAMEWVHVK